MCKQDAWSQRHDQCGKVVVLPASLAEPLIGTLARGVQIIPPAWTQLVTATCNYGDFAPDAWCKHIAAIGYQIIHSCELDPYYPFQLRQLDLTALTHASQKKRARAPDVICLSDDDDEADSPAGGSGSADDPVICE